MKIQLLIFLVCFCTTAQSKIWYVNASNSGNQDGLSWETAFRDLQIAIDSAQTYDRIYVAKGIYYPSKSLGGSSNPRDRSFKLGINNIYGGFAGTEKNLAERGFDSTYIHVINKTILSGDLGIKGDNSDNAYHVVTIVNSTFSRLDGFTIEGGNANGLDSVLVDQFNYVHQGYGGAVYAKSTWSGCSLSYLMVINNTALFGGGGFNIVESQIHTSFNYFLNNSVKGNGELSKKNGGGAIRNTSGLTIHKCLFRENSSENSTGGGAVSGSAKITDSKFINNFCLQDHYGGGALKSNFGGYWLSNCSFSGNSTDSAGGAIMSDTSEYKIENCTFTNNSSNGSGGAIYAKNGTFGWSGSFVDRFNLVNCTFTNNQAGENGGALCLHRLAYDFSECNFESNHSNTHGGAIYINRTRNNTRPADGRILNCTFSKNETSHSGGALFNRNSSSPNLTSCFFTDNVSSQNGGAIYNTEGSHPVITNCLISENVAGNNGGGVCNSDSIGQGCNPVFTNTTIAGNFSGNKGGGLFNEGQGLPAIRNTIISANIATMDSNVLDSGFTIASIFNRVIVGSIFFQTGTSQPMQLDQPIFLDPSNNLFMLNKNSQAINVGNNSVFKQSAIPKLSDIEFDIIGNSRINGATVDLGAFEFCHDTVHVVGQISLPEYPIPLVSMHTELNFQRVQENTTSIQWFINDKKLIWEKDSRLQLYAGHNVFDGDTVWAEYESSFDCSFPKKISSNGIIVRIDSNNLGIQKENTSLSDETPTIWPNPIASGDELKINFGSNYKHEIRMYDTMGKLVDIFPSHLDGSQIIVLPQTEPGIYLLEFDCLNRVIHKRLVVY